MDKLTKLASEHGEIFEALVFFKKAMLVVNLKKTPVQIKEFDKLFQEYVVVHFAFEENSVFPEVLKKGGLEAKKIVRDLQRDHIDILAKVDDFKDLMLKSGNNKLGLAQIKKLAGLSQSIIKLVLAHARKEDNKFFPLVKNTLCLK